MYLNFYCYKIFKIKTLHFEVNDALEIVIHSYNTLYIILFDSASLGSFIVNTVKPRLFEVPGTAGILSNNW